MLAIAALSFATSISYATPASFASAPTFVAASVEVLGTKAIPAGVVASNESNVAVPAELAERLCSASALNPTDYMDPNLVTANPGIVKEAAGTIRHQLE